LGGQRFGPFDEVGEGAQLDEGAHPGQGCGVRAGGGGAAGGSAGAGASRPARPPGAGRGHGFVQAGVEGLSAPPASGAWALSSTTGTPGQRALTAAHTAWPSAPGIIRSVSTRLGGGAGRADTLDEGLAVFGAGHHEAGVFKDVDQLATGLRRVFHHPQAPPAAEGRRQRFFVRLAGLDVALAAELERNGERIQVPTPGCCRAAGCRPSA
jgi:hypothetical protein